MESGSKAMGDPRDGGTHTGAAFGASYVPTISTYRDTLTVSMGFCEEDMDAAWVERVLQLMDGELDRA